MNILNKEQYKILIVDDNTTNIQVVAAILDNEKYSLSFAKSGVSALSQTRKMDYDLILLDIMMPGLDGFDVCKILKDEERTKDIPIIFLTAKADIQSVVSGFDIGGADYITKPFNSSELIIRVKNQLQLREANMALKQEIKERKAAEEALRISEQRLTALNATKDKFFSIIAHDLKNPFNTMMGFSQLLITKVKKYNDEKLDNFAEHIFNAAKHGYNLLQNLLEWSRTQTDRIDWKPQEINILRTVNTCFDLLSTQAAKKNVKLTASIKKEQTVVADPNMLNTIIRNLVSNAIKFSFENSEIKVEAQICEKKYHKAKKDFIEISVHDSGVGISENSIKKLFRIDGDLKTKGTNNETGTGLGLVLCKEFVEKHGGKIRVESQLGMGSIFFFTLPVGDAA